MSITYISFYPSDWLGGTRRLSAEETGVYITLVCQMYEDAGAIERDDERLHRLCGTKSRRTFSLTLDRLISMGKIMEDDGLLSNVRVQEEIEKITKVSAKAKAAADARWKRKPNKNNGGTNAGASSRHMPTINHKPLTINQDIFSDENIPPTPHDYEVAAQLYNEMASRANLPKVQKLTEARKTKLRARLKDAGGIDGWTAALAHVESSTFLTGANRDGWKADLDFMLQESSFTKIMEGSYQRGAATNRKSDFMKGLAEWASEGEDHVSKSKADDRRPDNVLPLLGR